MKSVNVTELKAHLSKYLRMASRGSHIVVKDRDEPIAQLGPLPSDEQSWRTRLAQSGRLRPGTQGWSHLKISRVAARVNVRESLEAVREDPSEVRRR
jgi:antitoxin (DNA-binding transcriptional repressor) of toxin-antitoxin stability system